MRVNFIGTALHPDREKTAKTTAAVLISIICSTNKIAIQVLIFMSWLHLLVAKKGRLVGLPPSICVQEIFLSNEQTDGKQDRG